MKFKHFETQSGKTTMVAQFDGYSIADRMLEGLMFQITIQPDGTLKASVKPEDEGFFSDFNTTKFLKLAEEYAETEDGFTDPVTGEDCWIVRDTPVSTTTTPQPVVIQKANPLSVVVSQPHTCGTGCNHNHTTTPNTASSILEQLVPDETPKEEEVKEPIIGKFTPKRKFLNFVQGKRGGVRIHSNTAYIKSEQLTGTIEDTLFKITICDNGTINFEEVGTNHADDNMIKRFIDDIDEHDVTGYMQKFVVHGFDFADGDGQRMYLEVEHSKPIDKLFAIFDEVKEPEIMEKEEVKVSDNAQSLLDSLFGDSPESETTNETTEMVVVEEKPTETYSQQMIRESFEAMNAEKIVELSDRIEKKEKDIKKYQLDIRQADSNLKSATDDIKVLHSRLDSLKPAESPNDYVFFVSTENTTGVVLDQALQDVVKQISPLLKLKEDKVIEFLTKGYYTIKIAKKGDISNDTIQVEKEIYSKINKLDVTGKVTMVSSLEFEYRGELTWHKLVDKMIRLGFEQDPEFDKACGSVSYQSNTPDPLAGGGFSLNVGVGANGGFSVTTTPMPATAPVINQKFDKGYDKDKVQSDTLVSKTLYEFTEPTTIIIMDDGGNTYGSGGGASITDDETCFAIYLNEKKQKDYTCQGFVNVLTLEQYKSLKKSMPDLFEDNDGMLGGVVVPDFVGKVGLAAVLGNGKFSTDFDISDYIQHQFDDCCDVAIILPEGTKFYDLDDDLGLPLNVIRDHKINSIIG